MAVTFTRSQSVRVSCLWVTLEAYYKLQAKLKTIPELKDTLQQIWTALPQKCYLVLLFYFVLYFVFVFIISVLCKRWLATTL